MMFVLAVARAASILEELLESESDEVWLALT